MSKIPLGWSIFGLAIGSLILLSACEKSLNPALNDPKTGREYTYEEIGNRPVDVNKLLTRLPDEERECYRAATARIATLGKPFYPGTSRRPANNRNLDVKTGEMRWDVWAGSHLFAFPEETTFYPVGGFPDALPGVKTRLSLEVPYARPYKKGSINPIQTSGASREMWVDIRCDPRITLASHLARTDTQEKAWRHKRGVVKQDEKLALLVRASPDGRGTAGYIPTDDNLRSPSGGLLMISCDEVYPPVVSPSTANCSTGFAYKDGIRIGIMFREAYLPQWRETLTNAKTMLDESYRN